jgi:RNA polymerase sigma-70 factor, ECF subfamily
MTKGWHMSALKNSKLFTDLIAQYEGKLYAYIFSVVRNWEDADDLYQTVCLVLWSKIELFRPGTSFFAWARQTAKNTVRDYLKRKHARRFVSEEVLYLLSETSVDFDGDEKDFYIAALHECKNKLDMADQELLELRYVEDLGSRQIADQMQRPQSSICRSLVRIQHSLLECIRREMAKQEHSQKGLV